MRRLAFSVLFILAAGASAAAQQSVFVVRHAERADGGSGGDAMMARDPDLSEAGRARAESLAYVLKDAKIRAIFVTEFKRTLQTADPLAKALGIKPTVASGREGLTELVARIKNVPGNVLVVAHSNTLPDVVEGLGAPERPKIADDEYDNLFVVVMTHDRTLLRLHYR